MKKTISLLAASAALAGALVAVSPAPADAAPIKYKNCSALNKKYPHGVGRPGARDKSKKPVRNFRVNRAVYNRNTHRDRDKDGIACEKR